MFSFPNPMLKSCWFRGLCLFALSLSIVLILGQGLRRAEAQPGSFIQQGANIFLAGKSYPVAWAQWQDGGQLHTGISDVGAMQILGLEFLPNSQPETQPLQWFSERPLVLPTRWLAPYRYLDVTELLQRGQSLATSQGDRLNINPPGAKITRIRQGQQPWGQRLVLELTGPTFWQLSQAKTEGAVLVQALNNTKTPTFTTPSPAGVKPIDEDDLGTTAPGAKALKSFQLLTEGETSKLLLSLPPSHRLQVSTLTNPDRLVVDVRAEGPSPRAIAWAPGLEWRQEWINIPSGRFPIWDLSLDLKNMRLRNLTATPQGVTGTNSLTAIVQNRQAVAAINGGFFNRKTQLPLGALKNEGQWLSGPILQRGVMAWNDQGEVKFGRLSLKEHIVNATGQRTALTTLNSGYVQAGIARYTPTWGPLYRPLTDNETASVVVNSKVVEEQKLGPAGQREIPIPAQGYLLIQRGAGQKFWTVGDRLSLESQTLPVDLGAYDHILGAGPLLLQRNRIVLDAAGEKFSPDFQRQKASRSGLALDSQGHLHLLVVHQRLGGAGATLTEWAQILKTMGMNAALNLDGGSSSALVLGGQLLDRSPVTAAKVSNGLGVFFLAQAESMTYHF
jgi:hypothetical protein